MLNTVVCGYFRLEKLIRSDTCWTYYRGIDIRSDQQVEVQVLCMELSSSPAVLSGLTEVTQLLDSIKGENHPGWLATGESHGMALIVSGITTDELLSSYIQEHGSLPIEEVIELAYGLARTMEAIHHAGALQGVLNADGIIFPQETLQPVVKHPALASYLDIPTALELGLIDDSFCLAPEMKSGHSPDKASDIYALGTVLYEALTGQSVPEPDLSPDRTMVVTWMPSQLRDDIPAALDNLVAACLHPELSSRMHGMGNILSAIEELRPPAEPKTNNVVMGMEDALVGQTLGPYRLVERMGQGGMASVYKGYEAALDRYVAVKILPQFFANDPTFSARFVREAKAVAQLEHPNIVPIYSFGEDNGISYIAMQLVKGGTLKYESSDREDYSAALRLMIPITRALGYAHKGGIIHRDVKPSNVLIREDGWPMLADFGLAKMAEMTSEKLTGTGVGMGTPMYMSPEQGQGAGVDLRTDIYSLGIMLYELVTGDVPFHADTPMAIVIKHMTAPMPMPRSVNPDLPEEVEAIILKATAKNPADRYQTAEEMAQALERALAVISGRIAGSVAETSTLAEARSEKTRKSGKRFTVRERGSEPGKKRTPLQWMISGLVGIVAACILGVVAMGLFDICPPEGPWPQPPWCEGSTFQFSTGGSEDGLVSSGGEAAPVVTVPQVESGSGDSDIKVCMVTGASGVEDGSIFQAAWQGVQRAVDELGVEAAVAVGEDEENSYNNNIHYFVQNGCDLIITGGHELRHPSGGPLDSVGAYPDQRFLILDREMESAENAASLMFETKPLCFIAGYLAAASTETGTVGVFGAESNPAIDDCMAGYYGGVQEYNRRFEEFIENPIQVVGYTGEVSGTAYINSYSSMKAGYDMALALMDEGAGVIMPLAGKAGLGAAMAVQERGQGWVIGDSTDWRITAPVYQDVVFLSIVKGVEEGVYDRIQQLSNGIFDNSSSVYNLENGGVALSGINELYVEDNPGLAAEFELEIDALIRGILDQSIKIEVTVEEPDFTCALITPNPLGDRSFIDSSARGIDQINAELSMDCTIIETNGVAEQETALRGAIQQGFDLIMGLVIDSEMFINLANEFPDQKFGSPSDVFAESLPDNLMAFQIDTHEASFLVGLTVGSMTETKIVGAVVGGDAPFMNQFFYGYKQGVLEACSDCEVLVSYLGFDFANPTLGLESALAQYEQGADIIFQVAGGSGEGVLEAAAQTENYAIGVDSNQDYVQPGHIITSMIKRVDTATFLIAKSVVDGDYAGGFHAIGLADGAAGLSWDEGSTTFADEGPEDMVSKLADTQALVEDFRAKVLSGEYEVCNALNVTAVCDPFVE